jgi:hypothetical protein
MQRLLRQLKHHRQQSPKLLYNSTYNSRPRSRHSVKSPTTTATRAQQAEPTAHPPKQRHLLRPRCRSQTLTSLRSESQIPCTKTGVGIDPTLTRLDKTFDPLPCPSPTAYRLPSISTFRNIFNLH